MLIANLQFLNAVNHLLSAVHAQSVLSLRRVGDNRTHRGEMESVAVDVFVIIVLSNDIDICELVFQH